MHKVQLELKVQLDQQVLKVPKVQQALRVPQDLQVHKELKVLQALRGQQAPKVLQDQLDLLGHKVR